MNFILRRDIEQLLMKRRFLVVIALFIVCFAYLNQDNLHEPNLFFRNMGISRNPISILDYIMLIFFGSIIAYIAYANILSIRSIPYDQIFLRISSKRYFCYKQFSLLIQVVLFNASTYFLAITIYELLGARVIFLFLLKTYIIDCVIKLITIEIMVIVHFFIEYLSLFVMIGYTSLATIQNYHALGFLFVDSIIVFNDYIFLIAFFLIVVLLSTIVLPLRSSKFFERYDMYE